MKVLFTKTSNKTYSVEVQRPGLPRLTMNKAPGYDDLVPHDMQHFLVEHALKLKLGVFGQIAAGGTAATFFPEKSQRDSKGAKRKNRKLKSRGKDLLAEGKQDGAISERATYVCMYNWLKSSDDPAKNNRAREMKDIAQSILSSMDRKEQQLYSKQFIERVNTIFQDASDRWQSANVNDSVGFDWA